MKTLKIYGTGSATANAVAQVTIPNRTRLRGVQWDVVLDGITDSSAAYVELSRASAREIAVNGAQQCISEVAIFTNFVTSGLSSNGINIWIPLDLSYDQGQIIYLHALVSGTATYIATANIQFL